VARVDPPSTSFSSTLARESLVCLGIGIPAVAYVLGTNHTASLGVIALHALLLGALTPVAVTLLERAMPRAIHRGWLSVLRALGVRVLGLSMAAAGMVVTLVAVTPLTLGVVVGGPLLVALVPVFLAYGLVALGVQWAGLREHALRVEANETRARQAALAARIRPHFLFNALTCIEELTDTDTKAAREAVGQLARLLRAVLRASEAPKGVLEDELRLVSDYLAIERLRFGERFRCELRLAPEVARCEVPATVLLTLAENAVKHGIETTRGPALLRVEAGPRPGGGLRVLVASPFNEAQSPRIDPGIGYGLADVRERLALLYRDRAEVQLRFEEGEGRVELVLPE